jgi:hypothetical protein
MVVCLLSRGLDDRRFRPSRPVLGAHSGVRRYRGRAVHYLDLKRCHHCVHPLATVTVEDGDGFRRDSPVLLCYRCDRLPHPEDATFVPDWRGTS